MRFADGEQLETDIVVFSAGIRPQDALGRSSGLATGERGGICIDNQCQTSDKDVFAIGECALWEGKILAGRPGLSDGAGGIGHAGGRGERLYRG